MFSGLFFIHSNGIIHFDLNPSNMVYNPKTKKLQMCYMFGETEVKTYAFEFGGINTLTFNDLCSQVADPRPKSNGYLKKFLTYKVTSAPDAFSANPTWSLSDRQEAIDLVFMLLTLRPTERITVDKCLTHNYFK